MVKGFKKAHFGVYGSAITGYKKVVVEHEDGTYSRAIVKLLIPANARVRTSWEDTRKCRCDCAIVMSITLMHKNLGGETNQSVIKRVYSHHSPEFEYKKGELIYSLNRNKRKAFSPKHNDCGFGIHFYMVKKSAENHV